MKKNVILAVFILIAGILLCGCTVKQKQPTINYQGRLKKYIQTIPASQMRTIDLSDGQKVKYDANLGPKDVNFDFKIKNPY